MGAAKDRICTDFLFDDGAHNIINSTAAYPVLMRRPWNAHLTGMLSVNSYEDFLQIVEVVVNGYREPKRRRREPVIMALVGPSGSGKTCLAEAALEHTNIRRPISTTTREKRLGEPEDAYHFVSAAEFANMRDNGELLEHTMYAENGYGLEKQALDDVLDQGKHAILVMDMCGAMAVKSKYPHAITVYVKRGKRDRLLSLLERDVDNGDKANRIIAMDCEERNEELCDYTINNTGKLETALVELESIISAISTIPIG